jgi:hypothetical protein
LSERESRSSYFKREELRGLFVLGLLAVVASIRIQSKDITFIINEKSYNVTIFLDIMLIMWSCYAFFMVLGFSEDIIGKKTASMFREVSTTYLYFSFLILGGLGLSFWLTIYPIRALSALGFLLVPLIYQLIRIRKSFKLSSENPWKQAKPNLYQLLLLAFAICFLLIMLGIYEEFAILFFATSSICLASFLIARERVKRSSA